MKHHYNLGERVGLAFGFYDQEAIGLYEIIALLPTRSGAQPQYGSRMEMTGSASSGRGRSAT